MVSPSHVLTDSLFCPVRLSQTPFTRYNRLSNRLCNRLDNRLYGVNKHPTGCQTGCQNGLITSWMFVYTIQPVVKPCLSNRFEKHGLTTVFNEQLFVQPVVKPCCTTGLTTGCIHDTAVCQTGCQAGLTSGWVFVYTIQSVVKLVWHPFDNRLYRVNGAQSEHLHHSTSVCQHLLLTLLG